MLKVLFRDDIKMVGVVCTEDGMEIVMSQPWIVSPPARPTAIQAGFLDCPEEAKVSGFDLLFGLLLVHFLEMGSEVTMLWLPRSE
jgi:hypothetical protein